MSIKHISTLVSAGQHPISGEYRHCKNDSIAMTIGLELAKHINASCQVLHAGRPDNPALGDYLALGASQIDVIPTATETDIVNDLAMQLGHADLILTGCRAENGEDSGLLPYLLANKLGIPLIVNALEIKATAHGMDVLQFLPKGKRRRVSVQLPAVIAIHPLAPAQLRFAYARQQTGGIKQISTSQTSLSTATPNPLHWQCDTKTQRPVKLKAHENKSGHERMMAAISSESKGGTVVNNGNSVEKAQVILRYLREHHLINF